MDRGRTTALAAFWYSSGMQVTVEIPDRFAHQVVPKGSDPARLLFEDAVAQAYRERRLTMEEVRQLLGFDTRMEVDPFLLKYEIYDDTIEELESDLKTMERLFATKRELPAA